MNENHALPGLIVEFTKLQSRQITTRKYTEAYFANIRRFQIKFFLFVFILLTHLVIIGCSDEVHLILHFLHIFFIWTGIAMGYFAYSVLTQFDKINTLTFIWKLWLCASCMILDPINHIAMYTNEYFDCSSKTIFNSTWCSVAEYLIRNPSNPVSEEIEYLCFDFERFSEADPLLVLYSCIRMAMTLSVYVAVLDCIDRLWKHTKNWKLPAFAFCVFLFNLLIVYWNNQVEFASTIWFILHFVHHSTFNLLPIWIYFQIIAYRDGNVEKKKQNKTSTKGNMLRHNLLESMENAIDPSMNKILVEDDTFRSVTQQVPQNMDQSSKQLAENPKLQNYDEFVKESTKRMEANVSNLSNGKVGKDGVAFWSAAINKMAEEKKEKKSVWKQMKVEDKLVNYHNNKIFDFLDEILGQFIRSISLNLERAASDLVVSADDIFCQLRQIPIIGEVLAENENEKESPWNAVIPAEHRMRRDGHFTNWGLTIANRPSAIFYLHSVDDIVALVKKARADKKRVRVMNYSHSYSPIYGDDGCYFGKMLDDKYTHLQPVFIDIEYNEELTECWVRNRPLMFVKLDFDSWRISVGGATPNAMYIKLIERRIKKGLFSFPAEYANVIGQYQSFAGTHAVGACHGGGINTTNLSAYITRLSVINAEGKSVIYSGDILKTVASHFGLLGIVHELQIQCKRQYFAIYDPYVTDLVDYLPQTGECKQFQTDVAESFYNEFFCGLGNGNKDKMHIHALREIKNPTQTDLDELQLHSPSNTAAEGQILKYVSL